MKDYIEIIFLHITDYIEIIYLHIINSATMDMLSETNSIMDVVETKAIGSEEVIVHDCGSSTTNKRVSFSEEMTENLGNESESSSVTSEETFLPSISSMSEFSDESTEAAVRSRRSIRSRSIHSSTRDVKNVLTKKYSKLAMSVQSVREGQPKRHGSTRRFKR